MATNAPKAGVRKPHLTQRVMRGLLMLDNQRRGIAPARLSRFDETAITIAGEWIQGMVDWFEASGRNIRGRER